MPAELVQVSVDDTFSKGSAFSQDQMYTGKYKWDILGAGYASSIVGDCSTISVRRSV